MSATDPRQPDDPTPTPPAATGESLPTIDLGSEGEVDLGELSLDADGSAVPLAELPEPPSGQSLTSWTEVIRRQRAAQEAAQAAADSVQVDAPSDKDILNRVDPPEHTGDTSEIRPADLPVFTPPPLPGSESDIDLGRGSPSGTGESEVGFDILYPPSDAGGAMPQPSSGIDFGSAALDDDDEVPLGIAPKSGVDLGAAADPVSETGRSSILDVLLRESAGAGADSDPPGDDPDLGGVPPARAPRATMPNVPPVPPRLPAVPTQPGIDMTGGDGPPEAELDLSGPSSEFGSDEAVDLYAEAANPPSLTDSGTLEISDEAIEESQRRAEALESSAVDLSSRPGLSSDFQMPPSDRPGRRDSDADIDLDLPPPPARDAASSSMSHRREDLDAETDVEAVEADEVEQTEERPARGRRQEVVPAREGKSGGGFGKLVLGGALGLLIGAGGVLGAYFGGILGDSKPATGPAGPDRSAEVARAKQEADEARAGTEALRKSLTDLGIDPENPGEKVKQLQDVRDQSNMRAVQLAGDLAKANESLTTAMKAATDAKAAEETAKKAQTDAEKALTEIKKEKDDADKAVVEAKKQLTEAMKATDTAKAEAVAAKKTADEAADAVAKALKAAGVESAKADEGIKKLAEAKAAAEAKEKDAAGKVVQAAKKEVELMKAVDTAKKAADDAAKARDASVATVKAIADKLAKAKFVGDQPDAAALVKGLEDALKAATTDATTTLREELAKARAQETKLTADLAAAKAKEQSAAKEAAVLKADAVKLAAEAAKNKADAERLTKEAGEAAVKAAAAERAAAVAKAAAEQAATEAAKVKAENEKLAGDLEGVREIAAMVRTPAASTAGPAPPPDPVRVAERFFDTGLRNYFAGQHTEAAAAFKKAIHHQPDDARFHYLLGLALWSAEDAKGAEVAFEKGRDLELSGRPASKSVSAALERIQGRARQAINSYRP